MKKAVIALTLIAGLLVVFLVKTRSQAGSQTENLAKELQSLSNKVTEAQTRLVMNQALSNDKLSTLQINLDLRLKELASVSNLLQQARQSIASEQQAGAKAASEAQAANARVGELEDAQADLKRKLEPIPGLEAQIKTLTSNLAVLSAERDALSLELREVRLSEAEGQRKLQDPVFLRLQTARLEDEARLAKQLASAGSGSKLVRKSQLELMPDGTVKLKPPTNIVAKASSGKKPAK